MVFVLLLALAGIGLCGWIIYDLSQQIARLEQRLDASNTLAVKAICERDFYLQVLPLTTRTHLMREWQQHLADKQEVFNGTTD